MEIAAQTAGPNRNVVSGVVDPSDQDAFVKTDIFLQRQNEGVIGASSVNAEHLMAAANDYRTIDVADDFGLGEDNEGFFQSLVASIGRAVARLFGRPVEEEKIGSPAAVPDAWIGVYRSCTRGQTWIGGLFPGSPHDVSPASLASPLRGLETASDAVLAPAHDGIMYVGGLAFIRGGRSRIFVGRYTDRNNREGGSCFVYDFTSVVASGAADANVRFVDKPAIAVDVPRGGAAFGNVYVAYARFKNSMTQSEIFFSFSGDGGETWSEPQKVSGNLELSQGPSVVVNPDDGRVFVGWRDFNTNTMYVRETSTFVGVRGGGSFAGGDDQLDGDSDDKVTLCHIPPGNPDKRKTITVGAGAAAAHLGHGDYLGACKHDDDPKLPKKARFRRSVVVTPEPIYAFDQPTDFDQFRTNGFISLAAGAGGRMVAVWQELVNEVGVPAPFGSPRIVVSLSFDGGRTWSPQRAVDIGPRIEEEFQPGLGDIVERPAGPQVMPAISENAGQWMMTFYESRDPLLGSDGFISGIERQLDLRAAILNPDTGEVEGSSIQVSQYPIAGTDPPALFELNPGFAAVHRGNLTMFRGGTVPFDGDYNVIAPSVPLVKDEQGWKRPTSAAEVPNPSFHEIHTDNRNVAFPGGDIFGAWDQYTPPGSGALSCINPGSRNQDLFTSEISTGIVAGSPSIYKPLLTPDGEPMPRTFVVYVENRTTESRLVKLEVVANEAATTASFDQLDGGLSAPSDDFEILPYSTLTRTVFLSSSIADGSARVDVSDAVSSELLARVILNKAPSPFAPTNTEIGQTETHNPRLSNPRLSNLGPMSPRLSNRSVATPRLSNPRLSNEALPDTSLETTDVTVTVTNDGNTTTVYNLLTNVPNEQDLIDSGKYAFQMIVQRTSTTPAVGTLDPTCSPVVLFQDEVISSVPAPRLSNPRLSNPRLSNPRLSNVAFFLEPAEGPAGGSGDPGNEDSQSPAPVPSVTFTLRVFQTEPLVPGDPVFDPTQYSATVVAQSIDVIDGQLQEDPQFVSLGPNPPEPRKEVDGDLVPLSSPPAPPAQLAFLAEPTTGSLGQTMSTVTVRVEDAASQPLPLTGIAVTLRLVGPSATLSGTVTQLTENGVATFSDLSVDQVASGFQLTAASPGLLDVTSTPFDIVALPAFPASTTTDSGPGSLRQAILDANASPGVDVISFASLGPGPHTITLTTPLPPITEAVIIDGTTVPGFTPGNPQVTLDGTSAGAGASGIVLAGPPSEVRGLQIVSFDGNGIELLTDGHIVEGNVIGTDPTGTVDLGNSGAGIVVASSDNVIGQQTPRPGAFLGSFFTEGVGAGQIAAFSRDVAFDPVSGDLFIADRQNNRVQRFDTDGTVVQKLGANGGDGTSGTGDGEFNRPSGITTDSGGNIYISDNQNDRVQKFAPDGTFITTWGTSGSADGEFNGPWGIASGFDGPTELIYVIDQGNHRVQIFLPDGTFVSTFGSRGSAPGEFQSPRGIEVDSNNFVYVPDRRNDRIQKFDSIGNFVAEWGSSGVGPSQFEGPNEIAFDSNGLLYVTDLGNDRYQVFDSDGNFIAVRGTSGAGPGEFIQTPAIAVDGNDDVYVLRGWNPTLQKFSAPFATETGTSNLIAFNGGSAIRVDSGTGNHVGGNEMYASPQAIDIAPLGPQPSAGGVPVLTAGNSIADYAFTKVEGTLASTPDTSFRLDFYYATTCNPLDGGQAQLFMGSSEAVTNFEGTTDFSVFLPFDAPAPGFVSATATSPDGNTTELSACIPHGVSPRVQILETLIPQLPGAITGQAYLQPLNVVGGTAPITFRPRRALDAQNLANAGLSLSASGDISGTPTGGFALFEVVAEDSSTPPQIDIQELFIQFADMMAITTASLADANVGVPYSELVSVTGGSGFYFFELTGDVPDGLDIDPNTGEIFGTPTTAATNSVVVMASETAPGYAPQTASMGFDIDVLADGAVQVGFLVQPTTTQAGQTISPVEVAIQDAAGDTVMSSTASVTLSVDSGPGTLAGTTTVAAVDGIARFTDLSIDFVGTGYTLLASAGGLTPDTSNPFDITVSAAPLTFNVDAGDDSSPGSLRQAILKANANVGHTDTIAFDFAGGGPHTITPTSTLPSINEPAIIDGTTQAGFTGSPIIELDGSAAGAAWGLDLIGGNTIVRGLVINSFESAGIFIGSDTNTIEGNYIGTDISGTLDRGNGDGIVIIGGSNNFIGGTTASARNIISGNGAPGDFAKGVYVFGSPASGNVIEGNYIGTDVTGTAAIPNAFFGVSLDGAAVTGNRVGGTSAASRNIISGNSDFGVDLRNDASGNLIQGNYIGTDINGTAALGNGAQGVVVDSASNNTVGGTDPGAGNLVSGNSSGGIVIFSFGGPATGNIVQGNLVGTDVNGSSAIANDGAGISLQGADVTGTLVGGTGAAARNVTSGNTFAGISIRDGANANLVQGNYVGTDITGSVDLGNSQGIALWNLATNNTIGGTTAGARNVVSGNDIHGVSMFGFGASPAFGNRVIGNYIGTNATGDASIGNSCAGVAIEGDNNAIGGTSPGEGNLISGNRHPGSTDPNCPPGNLSNGISMFGTATGNVIEGNLIGTTADGTAGLGNESSGVLLFGVSGNHVGGTSAAARNVISANVIGVSLHGGATSNLVQGNYIGTDITGTQDLGNGGNGIMLNGSSNNTIGGTDPGAGNVVSAGGEPGDFAGGIVVFSSSGPSTGNIIQGNFVGTDASGTIALPNESHGIQLGGSGVTGTTVGGTVPAARNVISGNNNMGIFLFDGPSGNLIQGNYVGTDVSGNAELGNRNDGIHLNGVSNNTIDKNIVADNGNGVDGTGIRIGASAGMTATGNVVTGNFVGTDPTGSMDLGNDLDGVALQNFGGTISGNRVGGASAAERNVISGNGRFGVFLITTSGDEIRNNIIGLDASGATDLGNDSDGVHLNNVTTATVADNVISGNGGDATGHGVAIRSFSGPSTMNSLTGNRIGTNEAGTVAVPNTGNGVIVSGNVNGNIIGVAADGNVISGNFGDGILIEAGADGTVVHANFIGTDAAGTSPLGNSVNGIRVDSSTNTNVGGTLPGEGNVIGANFEAGVHLIASGTVVSENFVGTDSTLTFDLGNGAAGVAIGPGSASGNTIQRNAIAFNDILGISILSSTATTNQITENRMLSNGGLGIDLGAGGILDGVTANDVDDPDAGPNGLQNYPIISSADQTAGVIEVSGTFNSVPSQSYRLEFFHNDSCDPSGSGEGGFFIDFRTLVTDPGGDANFTYFLDVESSGGELTVTATDSLGNTSEFSVCETIQ